MTLVSAVVFKVIQFLSFDSFSNVQKPLIFFGQCLRIMHTPLVHGKAITTSINHRQSKSTLEVTQLVASLQHHASHSQLSAAVTLQQVRAATSIVSPERLQGRDCQQAQSRWP